MTRCTVNLLYIRIQNIRKRGVAVRAADAAGAAQFAFGHAAGRALALGAEHGSGRSCFAQHVIPQAAKAAAEERMERIAPEVVHRLKCVFKRTAEVFLLCTFRTQVHLTGDTVYGFLIIHGSFILAAFFAFHKSKLLSERLYIII